MVKLIQEDYVFLIGRDRVQSLKKIIKKIIKKFELRMKGSNVFEGINHLNQSIQ